MKLSKDHHHHYTRINTNVENLSLSSLCTHTVTQILLKRQHLRKSSKEILGIIF